MAFEKEGGSRRSLNCGGRTHLRLESQETEQALATANYKTSRAFEGTFWFLPYF